MQTDTNVNENENKHKTTNLYKFDKSAALWQRAQNCMPGGVNSPVRAFKAVGGHPIFIQKAKGAQLVDVDGNKYIDYVGSWGPMILGHAHEGVVAAIQAAAENSSSFGAPCALEIALAERIHHHLPSMQSIRMTNSGTEATMTAIRLARGVTKRPLFIKFAGGYHGHADCLLVAAGSGALTLGTPSSPGVTAGSAADTLIATYNDISSVKKLFAQHGKQIAAIIVEPIAGNMNMIMPEEGFLQGCRDLCDQHGSILIFDEVMTGFRVAPGGAQALFNICPDLTTLGKIIGGGLPVGALGGKREIMQQLAPSGPIYQAGTLSGNPLAMAAGLATLHALEQPNIYNHLNELSLALCTGLQRSANKHGINLHTQHCGGMWGFVFTDAANINSYADVCTGNQDLFKYFFTGMLRRGVYLAPSAFEAGFMSLAHTQDDIKNTLDAADAVFCAWSEINCKNRQK